MVRSREYPIWIFFIFVPYFTLKVRWGSFDWPVSVSYYFWAGRRSEFFWPVHSGLLAPPCGALVLWVKTFKIDPPSKVLCIKPITKIKKSTLQELREWISEVKPMSSFWRSHTLMDCWPSTGKKIVPSPLSRPAGKLILCQRELLQQDLSLLVPSFGKELISKS